MTKNTVGLFLAERRLFALLVTGALAVGSGCGSSDERDHGATATTRGGAATSGKAATGGGGGSGATSGGLGPGGEDTGSGGATGSGEATGTGGSGTGHPGNAGGTGVEEAGTTGYGDGNETAGQAGNGGEIIDEHHVRGHVVDIDTARPLAGRMVVLGTSLATASRTTTDQNGEFAFDRPEGSYDAAVLEADGSAVTVYKGLSRPDLILAHRWPRTFRITSEVARVTGSVSGGVSYPLSDARDVVAVHLFTDEGTDSYLMGAGGPPYGPEYANTGRFDHGPLDAVQISLATFGRKDDQPTSDPAYTAFTTFHRLTLADGDMLDLDLDLDLEPIELGTIAGTVEPPDGRHLTEMRERYRYPYPEALLDFPAANTVRTNPATSGGAFEFELPVLTQAHPSLCLVGTSDEDDTLWTERCGLSFGDDSVSLELEPAPVLSAPAAQSTIDTTTEFSWSAFPEGIADLSLWPSSPSSAVPGITILTADATTTLVDLDALGIRFPTSVIYQVTLTGRGRYDSFDNALGPKGIGALIPNESRVSVRPSILVKTTP